MRLRLRTISGRLLWVNLLVTGIALLIAVVAFFLYDQYAFRQAIVSNMSAQAQIIGANSVSAITFNDPASAEATLSSLHNFQHVITAGILLPNGTVFAEYERPGATHLISLPQLHAGEKETHVFYNGEVILVRSIEFQRNVIGTVFIRSDLQALTQRLERYAMIASAVFLLCMLAAFFVARAVGRAVAGPVVQLANTAQTVSRDRDYGVRATTAGETGEVALLVEAFNTMLAQIEASDSALREAREELEQRVQERTRDLVMANRELEAFSYSVSHDLRGPLETISGFGYLLATGYADRMDQAGRDYVQHMRDACRRMSELIDDLLNLSRVSTTAMHTSKVDLTVLTREAARSRAEKEPDRDVQFIIHECKPAIGDPRLLQIVIENLVHNAWKYTSRQQHARIEFGCHEQNDRVIYFIRDNGAGFDPNQRDRLFRPFQRLHSESQFPGTGVGLATVQRIVQRHGGEIWADAAVNQGATFYFTLAPRKPGVAVVAESEAGKATRA